MQNAYDPERSMRRMLAVTVAYLTLFAPDARPQVPEQSSRAEPAGAAERDLIAAVDSIAERALTSGPIAGLSVAVVRGDSAIVSKGYGFADLENRVPATATTLYDIASVTKLLTAVAVLRLVEEGGLRLEDDVATLLPGFPVRHQGRRITVRHLLDHTSGLRDYEDADTRRWLAEGTPLSEGFVLDFLTDHPLDFEPGSRWSYSNSGYYLLALILRRITGEPFGRHIARSVARPLALTDTAPCDDPRVAERRSRGYEASGDSLVPGRLYALPGLMGDGGLCSTVGDLARLPGALRRGSLLNDATLARMTRATELASGVSVDYGLGVRRGSLDGHALWGHTGGMGSYWSALVHYVETGTTIVVLVNTDGGVEDALTIEGEIARAALGLGEPVLRDEVLSAGEAGTFRGRYLDGTGEVEVQVEGDRLRRVMRRGTSSPRPLLYQGQDVFAWSDYPMDRFVFHRVEGHLVGLSEYHNGLFATYRHAARR